MATAEERISRIEGAIPHLATKEDISDLRGDMYGETGGLRSEIAELRGEMRELHGEMRAVRWIMGGIGVALAALTLILKYLG